MSKEDFDLFWKTCLVTPSQGCNMPDVTVLYWHTAKEETSNFPWTRRDGTIKSHATAAVVRDLLTQVRVATRKNALNVTLIQNYSPCSRCVEEILKTIALAKEKRIKLEISLTFVALKGIRRPSWIWRGMEHSVHKVTINESNDNSLALRQLHEAGVKLSTFNPDTWKFLYTFLGNGLLVENRGKFLEGKFPYVESRLDEDKFMEADLKQLLRGVTVTSSSLSAYSSVLNVEWSKPCLTGETISEYKIVCKKVTVKNRDEDDRLWRLHQTVDSIGVKVTVSGESTSFQMTGLELDTFYDVTVEGFVKGLSSCIARKIFRTGNRVPIPSLQTPTLTRKLIGTARPRTSSSTTFNNVVPTPVRLKRSNSVQSASGTTQQGNCDLAFEGKDSVQKVAARLSPSGAARSHISFGGDLDTKVTSSVITRSIYRSNSMSSPTMNRPLARGGDYNKKNSDIDKLTESDKLTETAQKIGTGNRRIVSNHTIDTTEV